MLEVITGTFTLDPNTFPVMITDDNVPEGVEELSLTLTQFLPDIVVRAPNVSRLIIQDNDGKTEFFVFVITLIHSNSFHVVTAHAATPSTIGLEQDLYDVTEGEGFVEICAAILAPANFSLLTEPYQANLSLSVQSVTALGHCVHRCMCTVAKEYFIVYCIQPLQYICGSVCYVL